MRIFNQLIFLYQNEIEHRALSLFKLALLYNINPKTIVEVGVWKGANAKRLRHLFPDAHLFLIDPWKPYSRKGSPPEGASQHKTFEKAYQETKELFKNDSKTTIIRQTSLQARTLLPNSLDIIFIDGDHQYSSIKSDIIAWRKKLRPGGILSGHDYNPNRFPGVVKAVNQSFPGQFFVLGDAVWATIIS